MTTTERPQPRPRPGAPRPTTPATPDPARVSITTTGDDSTDTAGTDTAGTTTSSARRRRRRGGRGRGRGGASRPAGTTGDDVTLVDEDAPQGDSVQSQRDDATPDETSAAAPARRRRSGGTTSPQRAARPKADAEADEPAKPRTRTRTRGGAAASTDEPKTEPRRRSAAAGSKPAATSTAKPRTKSEPKAKPDTKSDGTKAEPRSRRTTRSREADVAAGGPTRLRSTRSRTGGGRDSGTRSARGQRREQIPIPPRVTDKLMVITEHGERDQIAILEGRDLVQHYVTRSGAKSMVGNVYLGRVQNVLPGMEAAFIDIGRGRNGVLYAGEVNYSPEDLEGPAPRIENVLKSGQAVMVQVTKDPMGGKGARLTAQVSMPGRYLVLAPDQGGVRHQPPPERRGAQASQGDPEEDPARASRRHRPHRCRGRAGGGVRRRPRAARAGVGRHPEEGEEAKAPAELYEEPELTVRVVRDLFVDEEFRGLVTDSQRVYDKVMEYVDDVAAGTSSRRSRCTRASCRAFEEHHVVEQIHGPGPRCGCPRAATSSSSAPKP